MKDDNYIPFLEDALMSIMALMHECDLKDIPSLRNPGITYDGGNVKNLIKEERQRRHQHEISKKRTKELTS